VIIINC